MLPPVALLDFMHVTIGRDAVEFDAFEHKFLFAAIASVVLLVRHFSQRDNIRLLLHLDVVGEVPELRVADVIVVHHDAGNVI